MEQQIDNKVFISCFAFNHVHYIEDAMRGFVMQETGFSYVAAVVDDASTDGEQGVIKRFLENEFDMVSAMQDETEDYVRVAAKHKTNENCTFVAVFLKYNHYSIGKDKLPYYKEWKKMPNTSPSAKATTIGLTHTSCRNKWIFLKKMKH